MKKKKKSKCKIKKFINNITEYGILADCEIIQSIKNFW